MAASSLSEAGALRYQHTKNKHSETESSVAVWSRLFNEQKFWLSPQGKRAKSLAGLLEMWGLAFWRVWWRQGCTEECGQPVPALPFISLNSFGWGRFGLGGGRWAALVWAGALSLVELAAGTLTDERMGWQLSPALILMQALCWPRGGHLELWCHPLRPPVWHSAFWWWTCAHPVQEDPWGSVLHPWVPQPLRGHSPHAHAAGGPPQESHHQGHQVSSAGLGWAGCLWGLCSMSWGSPAGRWAGWFSGVVS